MTDVRQLKAFVAVAEELNFHRAAERLGTVQPALSRLIQNLENDIQVQLLKRTTRHVELTESGKTFLTEARALLQQLVAAIKITQQTAKGTAGKLTLAYMDFAVHKLLPDMLAAILKEQPDIGISLTYMSTAQQRLALIEGTIDLGILIGQMSGPYVETVKLVDEPVYVVLPATHRLSSKQKLAVADLLLDPVLLGNEADWSAFRHIIFDLYAAEGASPVVIHEASSAAALMGLVAKGLGITFYAGLPSVYEGNGLVFRRLTPERKVPISLVWRKGAKLPLVRHVLKLAGLG
jgi:LysR family transcriptional regulator, benzoate and cis,cis-muconate-responsive activator of ben and cat genes